jgi:3-hydroxyacyl-[acyl-carrier-protein] dehydratase
MRDIEGIRSVLPLRFPYLMIDRLVEETPQRVVALKNVTVNEPVFQGHFAPPGPAVLPGTLILEAMAQTAAFLLTRNRDTLGYLVGVDRAHFRRPVVPGDQLLLTARPVRRRQALVRAEVEATVSDTVVASALISLVATREDDEAAAD